MRSQRHALSSDGESMCLSVHDPGLTQACREQVFITQHAQPSPWQMSSCTEILDPWHQEMSCNPV